MSEINIALFNAGIDSWNKLMDMVMILLTTSSSVVAGGQPYRVIHTLFNSIVDASIPIATCFFIIALYKEVVSNPPEQQAQRFLLDAIRYCIILALISNLWTILQYVMEFSDGITRSIGATSGYQMQMGGDLERIIRESLQLPPFELSGDYINRLVEVLGCSAILMIAGVTFLLTMVASALSIISSAFERILKPLIIMPFAGIAVAMGAGTGESARSMHQFFKTFFGLCISAAIMIVIIKAGSSLCVDFVNSSLAGSSDIENCIMITIQSCITPVVIAGLVKSTDHVIARML